MVTGASRGIGAAIAKALAAEGADVAITYEKSVEAADAVVASIRAAGGRAFAIQTDSADVTAVQASVDKAVAELGGLDILVNNAGILRLSTVRYISLSDIDALLNVNVRAVIVASKTAIPRLFADKVPGGAGLPVYALTKSALTAFSQGLARELGPDDTTVNVVQPGSIDTDMNPAHGPFGDVLRSITALGRYGRVEDVANLVTSLADQKAHYITGAAITVDGGANA